MTCGITNHFQPHLKGTVMAKAKGKGHSEFLAASKRLQSAWNKARKVKDSSRQDNAKIIKALGLKDGESQTVVARLTQVSLGKDKKNNPFVSMSLIGSRGKAKGLRFDRFHSLADKKFKNGESVSAEELIERLMIDLQRLGYDTEGLELNEEFLEIMAELGEEKPEVQLSVKRTKEYANIFLNKRLDDEEGAEADEDEDEEEETDDEDSDEEGDDDAEEDDEESEEEESDEEDGDEPDEDEESEEDSEEESEEDSEEESDEDESDEDDDEDDEDEGDEADDTVPEKDDAVMYKPKGSKKTLECQVTTVNVKAKTVSLRCPSNERDYKSVPWSDIEIIYEE
jgi:hypothetical protein